MVREDLLNYYKLLGGTSEGLGEYNMEDYYKVLKEGLYKELGLEVSYIIKHILYRLTDYGVGGSKGDELVYGRDFNEYMINLGDDEKELFEGIGQEGYLKYYRFILEEDINLLKELGKLGKGLELDSNWDYNTTLVTTLYGSYGFLSNEGMDDLIEYLVDLMLEEGCKGQRISTSDKRLMREIYQHKAMRLKWGVKRRYYLKKVYLIEEKMGDILTKEQDTAQQLKFQRVKFSE